MTKSILSKKTEIRDTSLNGKGTFAIEDIKKGEMIYIRGGELMRMEEAYNYKPGECPDGIWPITDEYWLGARNEEDFKEQKVYVNHSCNPNCGMRGDEEHISIGHAKPSSEPGQLRVSFFWKFYSDYNIMAVGEKGEWMLIGSSSPKYLWILSRTPTLPQKQLEYIIALAAQRGYNVNRLIFVKQD